MLKIGNYSMVTLTYNLRIDDENGELVEQATDEKPLEFLYGAGVMLPKFESQLAGLSEGEPFTITLNKNEAYGDVNEEAVVELPRNVFLVDGKFDDELIKVGNAVPMMSSNGQRLNGLVLELTDETVKMDFNHPLAGEDLYFSGMVLGVREASDMELANILGTADSGCSTCSTSGSCSTEHDHDHGGGCGCGV
jgi:FKBP-type peptidyl-prolyl cis-trans isomerase SlyD